MVQPGPCFGAFPYMYFLHSFLTTEGVVAPSNKFVLELPVKNLHLFRHIGTHGSDSFDRDGMFVTLPSCGSTRLGSPRTQLRQPEAAEQMQPEASLIVAYRGILESLAGACCVTVRCIRQWCDNLRMAPCKRPHAPTQPLRPGKNICQLASLAMTQNILWRGANL